MTAVEADFYDRDLENPEALAHRPLEDSPWLPLYQEAGRWIENWQPIVDLGCGTGRFAAMLAERGHDAYKGVDFSPRAIEAAGVYFAALADAAEAPPEGLYSFEFEVGDLREWEAPAIAAGSTTFVCLETLEHLDDDLALVAKIPPGYRLIMSVPNYGSASHVRRFTAPGKLWERYGDLLVFRRWSYIDLSNGAPGRGIHLVETHRRSDSWE